MRAKEEVCVTNYIKIIQNIIICFLAELYIQKDFLSLFMDQQ